MSSHGRQSAQNYSLAGFLASGERNLLVPAMRGQCLIVIPGRAKREPGISRFPDVQLHI